MRTDLTSGPRLSSRPSRHRAFRTESRHFVDRPRVLELFDRPVRTVLVVAPPGYGKTVAARQWTEANGLPTAWVSLDGADLDPATFWLQFTRAIRGVVPTVDDEAQTALTENVRGDLFLAVLIAQIERSSERAAVVLDDLSRLTDRSVLDGLALLVERVGDRLLLVITARADPALPIARWHTTGWVTEIRAEQLRLTDVEALELARTFDDLAIAQGTVAALNRRVAGWPIAMHLSLVSTHDTPDPESSAVAITRSDRHLADLLVEEILDRLPEPTREVALGLSVVDWFDAEMADELAGPAARAAVDDLQRRRLLAGVDDRPGAMRFHPLFRELLSGELMSREPERSTALHRAAAEMWRRRGDVAAAHRHLTALGDVTAATDLIMQPTLRLVDRGDHVGLSRLTRSLPVPSTVDDPALALDLAIASFFAGSGAAAIGWCERADALGASSDVVLARRSLATRSVIALMDGDLAGAARHVREVEHLATGELVTWPIEQRFFTVAARVALGLGDVAGGRRWLEASRAGDPPLPEVVATVTLPGLEAWLELLSGRLGPATELAELACDRADRLGARPHHGVFDALVTAAWCRLGAGDLAYAAEHADAARADAEVLGFDWNRVRAGVVAAEVRLLADGPGEALAMVRDVRDSLEHDASELAGQLDLVEAKALARLGRVHDAVTALKPLNDGPAVRSCEAAIALADGRLGDVRILLEGAESWPLPGRLEAAVLCAAAESPGARPRSIVDALRQGAVSGWVWPFLGHGEQVDELLRGQPLDELHPDLARHLSPAPRARPAATLIEPLTARELTVVALLPSHLSYAQIGEQLHLSVNTVKSNLKSIYRKLAVTTRAEAVDAARDIALL